MTVAAATAAAGAAVLNAEARSRSAQTIQSLAFTIVNETWQVMPYRQALAFRQAARGLDLMAVSGLASIAEDTPFTVWVTRLIRVLWREAAESMYLVDLRRIEQEGRAPEGLPGLLPDIVSGWDEWWPPYMLVVPLFRDGQCHSMALFMLEEAPSGASLQTIARLQSTWSYCAWALTHVRRTPLVRRLPRTRKLWIALAVVAALLSMPIRQAALAPAEIVALDGLAVAAPLDGVIKTFYVKPNQQVKAGQRLFSLDDTTLRNRREVALRALEVAAAELLSAQQRAFGDEKARSEVAVLQGRIAEKRAELQAVEDQLKRIDVVAPRDGIAVFGDVNDWQGKPVSTGERIMQLADPKDAGVMLYMPVADAIALDHGARIRMFLQVAPLHPIEARLTQTSYQAVLSPDGVASYRLRGTIDQGSERLARIGLKGTAKVYGERVPMVYFLLRRPLASVRQWSGL